MTGKVDLKWDTVIIVFGCFFLLLFCFYQSAGNRKFECEMIGRTRSVFKCLTCDKLFFFTAVYRLLNVVCALFNHNVWLRLFIEFKSLPGAAGFQLSNPPLWQTVSLLGSLNVSTSKGLIVPNVQRKESGVLQPGAWGSCYQAGEFRNQFNKSFRSVIYKCTHCIRVLKTLATLINFTLWKVY